MALKRRDNGASRDSNRSGLVVIDTDLDAEAEAFDKLPPAIRRRIADSNMAISTRSILAVHRQGAPISFILNAIEEAERQEAVANATMPGEEWAKAPLVIRAPPSLRTSAAADPEPRRARRQGRPKPRRLPRPAGSY